MKITDIYDPLHLTTETLRKKFNEMDGTETQARYVSALIAEIIDKQQKMLERQQRQQIAEEQQAREKSLEATRKREGGPAFPQPCTSEGYQCNTWYGIAGGGMSRRDYFAAHAPEDVAPWFSPPKGKPFPPLPAGAAYCEGCKADGDCSKTAACLSKRAHDAHVRWIRRENRKAEFVSWRWAYADAMIEGEVYEISDSDSVPHPDLVGVAKAADFPTPCAIDPNAEPPRPNDGIAHFCPCCERPNQFGEVCQQCKDDIERGQHDKL